MDIELDDNKIIIYPYQRETIKSFMTQELKMYEGMLNDATLKNKEQEIYLYTGVTDELKKCLDKYDELY